MDNIGNQKFGSLNSEEVNKIEEFRKANQTAVLVILFSDIVNSTYATEFLGEQAYFKLRHFHDDLFVKIMCRDKAGVIIKQIGDSFLCVFAEPSTSVLRSVEFQRAINKNKEQLTARGYTLTVKIGIHIGQVVVENSFAKDIFGGHVNRAARIESIANGGQILTSHSIWENAVGWLKENNKDEIGWYSYGKAKLKGIENKVDIFGFYPKEIGPPPAPKIFREQKRNRIILGITALIIIAFLSFFLFRNINTKNEGSENTGIKHGRKSFYVQFDFSKTPYLDTLSLKDIIISNLIITLYPDSIVTEPDLSKSFSKKGKLYSRRECNNPADEKYFYDTLKFSGALFINSVAQLNNKKDSLVLIAGLSHWEETFRSSNFYTLSTTMRDMKNYFRNWIQEKLTRNNLHNIQGVISEIDDSVFLFQIQSDAKLSPGALLSVGRIYLNKEGLDRRLSESDEKINYMKDKPQFSKKLKQEKEDFEISKKQLTDDLINNKGSWMMKLDDISGKVIELYDSIGKSTWTNHGIFPFVKPQKGDLIFLEY